MNVDGFADNTLMMPLQAAVAHVSSALRDGGFDVTQGVGMPGEKRSGKGSRAGGFRILGVSNSSPGHGAGPADVFLWWNVVLSEAGSARTRIVSVDPFSLDRFGAAGAGSEASQVRDRLARIIGELRAPPVSAADRGSGS